MTHAHSSSSDRPKRSMADALSTVTGEITRLLEHGVMPWRAPWDPTRALAATPGLPLRFTGEPYRGANVVLLWAAQITRGYPKRTWLSFHQALQLGGHVRKGEKATSVIFYGAAKAKPQGESAARDDSGERSYRFLKLFYVFNVEQIDGLRSHIGVEDAPAPRALSSAEQWLHRAGARVCVGGASAYYSPVTDVIHVPPVDAFVSTEHFEATLLHEGVHFTGAKSRLDRLSDYATDRVARAREELVAEIGSAILGAMSGLAPQHLEDHAAYIGDWLKLLRDDPKAFLSAAAKAQTAIDWLIEHAGHPADACQRDEVQIEADTARAALKVGGAGSRRQ